jgi:hypothetical protein
MASAIDIMLAIALGGLLLLAIFNANAVVIENSTFLNGEMLVQQLLISTATLVEGEFRNMGVGVAQDSATIVVACDSAISFLSDFNRDGTIDRVDYWLGPVHEIPGIQNDSVRLLHRRVSGGSVQAVGEVTKFKLRYFSQNEIDTLIPPVSGADLRSVKIIEITMEVQNRDALYRDPRDVHPGERNAFYSSSYWRQTRLASQNLKR